MFKKLYFKYVLSLRACINFIQMLYEFSIIKIDQNVEIFSGKMVPFVELTVAHASVLTILAISFERYYAICEPLRAGYVCTKARAMIICGLAWLLAALFTRYLTI